MATRNFTSEELIATFKGAAVVGTVAGNARIKELASRPHSSGKMLEECGGSSLLLAVDGRTQLGRTLAALEDPSVSVRKWDAGYFYTRLEYDLDYVAPVNGQEWSIRYEADKAAAAYIHEQLGINAYARSYID